MAAESSSFIDEVLTNGAGTLQELLGAEWTIIDSTKGATDDEISAYYADFYGLASTRRRSRIAFRWTVPPAAPGWES